jgi:DNA invertase Pin-like site-specific DNA recombinase
MKPRIYLYSRVSTPDQVDGHGLPRQDENNTKEAKILADKFSLEISDPITDAGLSGYKGKNLEEHAGLGGFLTAVKKGQIAKTSWLVVDEFSRLTRLGSRRLRMLMDGLAMDGINLSVHGREYHHDNEDEMVDLMGMFFAMMHGAKDKESSAEKSRNVKAAWAAKRKKAEDAGETLTERTVMWVEAKDGTRQLIPDRAKVVRDIFTWYLAGDGFDTIARRLNDTGVQTWKRRGEKRAGKQWYSSYIGGIVTNKAVIGVLVLNSKKPKNQHEDKENYYPPVISVKDFEAAQRIRYQKNKPEFAGRRAKVINPLQGLAKCAGCGHSLSIWTFVPKRKDGTTPHTRSFVCKQHGCPCYRKYWKYEFVLDEVMEKVNEDVWLSPDPLTIDRSQEIAVGETKLKELQEDLESAVNNSMKAKTPSIAAIWDKKIEELDAEINALKKEVEDLKSTTDREEDDAEAFKESAGTFRASRDLDSVQIRQHARNLLSSITVNCAEKSTALQWKVWQRL